VPNLYAIQFDVEPAQVSAKELADRLDGEVGSWIVDRYKAKWNFDYTYPTSGDAEQPLPDHFVSRSHIDTQNASLARIKWIHPHEPDTSLRWSTDIGIARCGHRVQFALQLGVTSMSFVVRPAPFSLGRPRIVSDILSRYSCWIGSLPLVAQKQQIAAPDVATFVASQLLDANRLLPLIVVSCDRFSEKPVIDPDRMQQTLLGFAQVVVVDKWASFQLTDCVGRALSCFNGCVRVYWPGLTRDSDPRRHWLYFPAQLERFAYLRTPLDRKLFSFLAQLSVFRFTDGDVIKAVQVQIEAERQAEATRLRHQIEEGRAAAKDVRELQELLDLAVTENDDLNRRVSELQAQNEDLVARLRDVQANFALIQQQQTLEAEGEADVGTADLDFESVSDALAGTERDFGSDLVVLDSARRSAAKSDFPRPDEVYQALLAIHDIGKLYLESAESGGSMGGWVDHLKARNFTHYSPTESDTVKNDYKNYGRHREFVVDNKKRRIYQHVDLGGGDRKGCLQIYFEADRLLGKIIIAHCGRHLPIPTDRT
jgi:hypothetical protein